MDRSTAWLLSRAVSVRTFTALISASAMFFVTTAHTANAGTNIWTRHGPAGGQVTAPAIDPTKPTTLYAGTFADGVFKRTDSGSSWSALNIGLTRPGVSSLAIDPSTPSTLDAGTTITVQTTAGGTGGPDCTLRDAITAANEDKATGGCVAGTGADTIVLEAGATYVLTAVDNDTAGPTGLPVIDSDIQIEGNGARIERSPEAPAFRLLYIGPSGILTLRGLALVNGLSGNSEQSGTSFDGGGIYNAAGTVVLEDIQGLSGNATGDVSLGASPFLFTRSSGRGGGIYNSGHLTIRKSLVDANRTGNGDPPSPDHQAPGPAGDGGAIYNVGSMTVESSVISANATGFGGGLGTGTVYGYGESGGSGGGIYNAGSMTVRNSRISSNRAGHGGLEDYGGAGGGGGGIFNGQGAVLNLLDSSVDGNRAGKGGDAGFPEYGGGAGGDGGGVQNVGGTVALIRTTVSGNSAGSGGHQAYSSTEVGPGGSGGGIFSSGAGGSLTIDNSTVSGNSTGTGRSVGSGGGIYAASVLVSRSTITDNHVPVGMGGSSAGKGGGIRAPTLSIDDSILAGNTSSGAGADCSGIIARGRFTLISDPVGCVLPADTVGLLTGEAANLVPLQDNGGPTPTHALCTGPGVPDPVCEAASPAIDAASSEQCFGTDQRGAARPFGAGCDMGAYESGAEPPSTEACVGDCDGSGEVTVNEIITMVNIALGSAEPSACPSGIPSGTAVDIALIIQAVSNALTTGCPAT